MQTNAVSSMRAASSALGLMPRRGMPEKQIRP
jgi:hypothetical protein